METYVGEGAEVKLHSFLIHLVDGFNIKSCTSAPLPLVKFEYGARVYQSRPKDCARRDTSCRRRELNHVACSLAVIQTELSLYSECIGST